MKIETNMSDKRLRAMLAGAGVDTEVFDVHAHIDRKLTYRENKANLKKLAKVSTASGVTRHAQRYQRATRKDDPFYQLPLTGGSLAADKKRRAKLPGKRVSKSGKKYTERRRNRSDRWPHLGF